MLVLKGYLTLVMVQLWVSLPQFTFVCKLLLKSLDGGTSLTGRSEFVWRLCLLFCNLRCQAVIPDTPLLFLGHAQQAHPKTCSGLCQS